LAKEEKSEGQQEKNSKFYARLTSSLNTSTSGHLSGKPQYVVLRAGSLEVPSQTETLLLTTNDLGVGCGQKWLKVE
jgi:hypothetical protein